MSEITPNTPNPVREDSYTTELATKLGIDPKYIPKSPVWRNEEEIAAIAEMFSNMAGGSSGGGVLVVHQDENAVLDKTWQEINDAGLSVLFFNDGGRKYVAYCTSVEATPPSWSVVYAYTEPDRTVYTITYIANSADGYPAYSE